MENQTYLFLIYIFNGFLISILFDFFRIIRKSFKTNNFLTSIEDILFWILTAIIILYSVFKFNDGELRGYLFVGITIGINIYMLFFSKVFIKINLYIINLFKKVFYYIFIIPALFVIKIFKKTFFIPIKHLLKKINKSLSFFRAKIKDVKNNKKKEKNKKDFA